MARGLEIEGLAWPDFDRKLRDLWQPGEHVSCIGPTGAGKTTLVCGLAEQRNYFIALDPKGGDDTLGALGLRRLDTWPGEKRMDKLLAEDEDEGRPSRFVVGPVVHRGDDLPKLRNACAAALDGVFDMGGWTVYVDELQIVADRRMMNLSGRVAKLLVAARSKGVSLISSFQAPSWVPSEAIRQPTWIAASYTRDTDVVNRMAEILGRPKAEIRGVMSELEKYHWCFVGRDPRAPIMITCPPEMKPKPTGRNEELAVR